MSFSQQANKIFDQTIVDYHQKDHVDTPINNPHAPQSIENVLYLKNWIDTVQWHLEDIIRNPGIDPKEALIIKRRIDKSNQDRTDLVEMIDSYFLEKYQSIQVKPIAVINTESPACSIDRLTILVLKIYHMQQEVGRTDVSAEHKATCSQKLNVLLEQRQDLSSAIDQLIIDIENGDRYMKVYKQMKMYNDPNLNPILYGKKS